MVAECLGKPGPTHAARASLVRKVKMHEREYDFLLRESRKMREAKNHTHSLADIRVLEEEAWKVDHLA